MKEKQVYMHATVRACWGREKHAKQQKEPVATIGGNGICNSCSFQIPLEGDCLRWTTAQKDKEDEN